MKQTALARSELHPPEAVAAVANHEPQPDQIIDDAIAHASPDPTLGQPGYQHTNAWLDRLLGADGFVWACWCLLLAGLLLFIAKFGSRVPYWDDWALVDMVAGKQALTWRGLWKAHNEHHIPLPKLIDVLLVRACQGDFRAGMFFNAGCLAALAAGMILAARRLRGAAIYADAFLPLACLHFGHWENVVWNFQVQFVSSTTLALLVLLCIVQIGARPSWKLLAVMGISTTLLPLCGANGAAMTPALALWLTYYGWRCLDQDRGGAKCLAAFTMAFVALGFVLAYAKGYQRVHPASPGWLRALNTAFQTACLGLGKSMVSPFWPTARLVAAFIIILSLLMLVWPWTRSQSRLQLVGYLSFLVACTSLALAIGCGRSGLHANVGFSPRYVTLALPLICCVYFIWGTCSRAPLNHSLQSCLLVLACVLILPNIEDGIASARVQRERIKPFERDVKAGMPTGFLADRYQRVIFPNRTTLYQSIDTLRKAKLGLFRHVSQDARS
jgi:hypothetical protein